MSYRNRYPQIRITKRIYTWKFAYSRIYFIIFIAILLSMLIGCRYSPLNNGSEIDDLKVEYVLPIERTSSRIRIVWKCSFPVTGTLLYSSVDGKDGGNVIFSIFETLHHYAELRGLRAGTSYNIIAFCGELDGGVLLPIQYNSSDDFFSSVNGDRSFWIFGGIGSNNSPVGEVDVYDPVTDTWFPNVTQVPTPRAYAGIIEYKGLVYVIGGMVRTGSGWGATNRMEVYDPRSNQWTRLPDVPFPSQGGVVGSDGNGIYLLAGTQSDNMVNDTVLNRVMHYNPSFAEWKVLTSLTAIFPRLDMGYCNLDSSIYFTGGRFYADGTSNATSDSFIPSINSTTSINEANISQARHGLGVACIRPKPTDPYPNDPKGVIAVGGSITGNVAQPVIAITPTDRYEFYQSGISTNVYTTGPNLPISVYYPAAELSYEMRKVFVFGGASAVNLPVSNIFAIPSGSPTIGIWESNFKPMPRARYGHKAILVGRNP
jgi:N-acetylneuraminic acid mutarotase